MRWKKKEFWTIDSGVKLSIAFVLGIIPFLITSQINFIILAGYLLLTTFFYGASMRDMMKSMALYMFIIIVPYIFGLLMATLVSKVTGSDMAMVYGSYQEVALRLIQLFLLWYASSLYFFSTSTVDVVGVFDRVLSPLKRMGVPVTDFLKVIMCVIKELKELAPEVKKSFTGSMGKLTKKSSWKSKINVISDVLVSFIVDSFQRLDEVEEYVRQVESKDLFNYKCKISKREVLLVISFVVLIGSMIFFENQVV
ncbi:hypothetical protein RJD24_20145 [Bacillaceae bacterium IKA-2]|nr:hypothetical protein RJD24_20145 [Bacillaceae bacterium IKA-2]